MSYGLQIFSPNGTPIIDSNQTGFLFGQIVTAEPLKTAVYSWPLMAGCQIFPVLIESGPHKTTVNYEPGYPVLRFDTFNWGNATGTTKYLVFFQ
ncbi:hypothetical protein [Chromobacterium phragmitis]|uniref:Uncharacterized protein n=1 Tax=Chromobacterium phragmitis TaxID=2202141 RepID=A0A344UPI4_9NEIS|nr:hypothetical protein [Chromobacterium phragmitis]AXE37182.1 hypothetical protein DK843_22805 [Chromobacterium phragmitis]